MRPARLIHFWQRQHRKARAEMAQITETPAQAEAAEKLIQPIRLVTEAGEARRAGADHWSRPEFKLVLVIAAARMARQAGQIRRLP